DAVPGGPRPACYVRALSVTRTRHADDVDTRGGRDLPGTDGVAGAGPDAGGGRRTRLRRWGSLHRHRRVGAYPPAHDRPVRGAPAAGAICVGLLACAALAATPAEVGERAFADVDPFIGTGGEGHTFPGATVPFGMVQLSPDTRIQPRKDAYGWAAGYRHDDRT